MLRELSLEEVAAATKLPARIVAALESDDLRAVGDAKYAVMAARACATAIGLDPDETALRLEEELQRNLPDPARPKPAWRRTVEKLPREPVVWVVLAVTLIAIAALFVLRP